MSYCDQELITDEAFKHLEGIHTLDMTFCTPITNDAFNYLKGSIHTPIMNDCRQDTITDEAFRYLKGSIHTLFMIDCNQNTITDAAFEHLEGTILY